METEDLLKTIELMTENLKNYEELVKILKNRILQLENKTPFLKENIQLGGLPE